MSEFDMAAHQAAFHAHIATWGPDCRRCHDPEFRIDGYCSIYCRDMHDEEQEVARLRAAILAHKAAVETGLLGKAEQDAADHYLWSLAE